MRRSTGRPKLKLVRASKDHAVFKDGIAKLGVPTVYYVLCLVQRWPKLDWATIGRRLRTTRIALEISEQEAADGFGVSLMTYRGYEAGRTQRGAGFASFARRYEVSIDWLMDGQAAGIGRHLAEDAKGKVAILPALGGQT
jgi:hypothetical protein